MARTFKISNGTDEVNLINTATTGFIAERGGFGSPSIPLGVDEIGRVGERWRFYIKASDHNNAATQVQVLIKLARQAKEYQNNSWRTKPVYLEQTTTNETNARNALVYEVRDVQVPDLF